MAIHGVDPKCYILALFVRDDKQRFLLGDDPFEFKDKQLHFQPNVVANDVVEVQGNDGVLLAGQVRRAGTQEFDGYVGNGTTSKAEVEVKRREFLQFFRKNHFYKVIYVFPDGSAIQRKQGFLVDDPTVEELYQQYPDYHVALNFQDVNYYTYSEDDEGEEIYSEEAIIKLVGGGATGGLIWDSYGVVWEEPWSDETEAEGTEIQVNNNNPAKARIDLENVYGDTFQQTYSGKNLIDGGYGSQMQLQRCSGEKYLNGIKITRTQASGVAYVCFAIPNELLGEKLTLSFLKSGAATTTAKVFDYVSNQAQSQVANLSTTGGTFTVPSTVPSGRTGFCVVLYVDVGDGIGTTAAFWNIQLELGSTATSYEPYTNGPAPNPDYPQDVQVVTGRQLVAISSEDQSQEYEINLGKNLWGGFSADMTRSISGINFNNLANGDISISAGTTTAQANSLSSSQVAGTDRLLTLQAGTYSISGAIGAIRVQLINSAGGVVANDTGAGATVTLSSPTQAFVRVSIEKNEVVTDTTIHPQLELGTSPTSYAPYFTPIELCKIGNYQDYIYKSGSDWYLHKATWKDTLPTSGYTQWDVANNVYWQNYQPSGCLFSNSVTSGITKSLITVTQHDYVTGVNTEFTESGILYGLGLKTKTKGAVIKNKDITTLAAFHTWIAANPIDLYYPLATPTDTQITNAALIAQLDALDSSWLFIGQNNILVSASSPNLPAPIKFSYMTKYAPLGAEWEEGGTKGPTIVDVNAIDNTYPVWELTGPSVNPTISVITTNTTLTYVGTITASQKLEIDMLNKTATLNGTSVIGNVSGDWVYMAPGTNRISYTAGNTDAPDSTLYWQEVVG